MKNILHRLGAPNPQWRALTLLALLGTALPGAAQASTAPLPGTVFKVLVKVGDAVQPKQNLLILEAMKMEIEIKSDRAATVSAVSTAVGASVQTGTPLVTLG